MTTTSKAITVKSKITENKVKDEYATRISTVSDTRPWIERYRPKFVDDLVVDDIIMQRIRNMIKDNTMPNILLTGIPGVGKTTTIKCIARHILGRYMGEYFCEINASDKRGIKAVQDDITNFCKKMMIITDESREYSKHKILLLDEADNMTRKAQQLLSTIMTTYPNTRFAFTCNNSSEIIGSIQSKCIILRYRKLRASQIKSKLISICNKENMDYTDEGITALSDTTNGDMRQAINNLQLISNGMDKVTEESVYKICDKPSTKVIKNIIKLCQSNNIVESLKETEALVSKGYSRPDIIVGMTDVIKHPGLKMKPETRIKYLKELSKTRIAINTGFDNDVQLRGCIIELSRVMC